MLVLVIYFIELTKVIHFSFDLNCVYQWTDSVTENYLVSITSTFFFMMLPVLKVLTHIITSITTHPTRLTAIPAITSVSTFKTASILYIF